MKLFTTDMTLPEVMMAYYKAINGKTEAEKKEITSEYYRVAKDIIHNELSQPMCLTSYQIK